MSLIIQQVRKSKPMHSRPDHTPAATAHDLPILAVERPDAPTTPDWPSLIDDGVQPALILGAERRLSGSRS